MLDMEEPSDAAVARHSAVDRQLGIADRRIEAWFNPFRLDRAYRLPR